MKKISQIVFVLIGFWAVVVNAQETSSKDKFWLSCAEITGNGEYRLDCYISQGSSAPDYGESFTSISFDSWNDLVQGYGVEQGKYPSASKHLLLGSDIVFDAYDSSSKKCPESYKSIELNYVQFDGKDHEIRNFCKIGNNSAFFGGGAGDTIQNVSFNNAHIEVLAQNSIESFPRRGAVVVDSLLWGSLIKKIVVKNSLVSIVADNPVVDGAVPSGIISQIGSLVAYAENTQILNNRIEDVEITGRFATGEDLTNELYVGGLVGKVRSLSENGIVAGNSVAAKLNIPFISKVYAGGLVGFVEANQGYEIVRNEVRSSTTTIAKNADNENLISLTATKMEHANVGGLIGRIENNSSGTHIVHNSVLGKVSIAANLFPNVTNLKDRSAFGGIVGYAEANEQDFKIVSNSSIGGIIVPLQDPNSEIYYTGFVVGVMYGIVSYSVVMGNYHYSEKDPTVRRPTEFFGNDEKNSIASTFTGRHSNYAYNYRNSIDGNEDGDNIFFGKGCVDKDGTVYCNPVIPGDLMRSRAFTYELISQGEPGLYWENDSSNGGLPYLSERRTVFRIILNIERFTDYETKKNQVADNAVNLKPYLIFTDTANYYLTYTNREGKIPKEFVDAYKKDLAKDYGLYEIGVHGAVLTSTKVYRENSGAFPGEYVYFVRNRFKYDVIYEGLPANATLAYVPAKVTSLDLYDPTVVAPRVYDVDDGYSEYLPTSAIVSCDVKPGYNDQTRTTYFYYEKWNFSDVLYDPYPLNEEECVSNSVVRLQYEKISSPSPVDQIVVEDNEQHLLVESALYGHDASGKFVSISDTSGDISFASRPIASQMEFFFRGYGYFLKSMDVEFWVYNQQSPDYKNCLGGTMDLCYDGKASPVYLGGVEELLGILQQYNAARWTITLDSTRRIVLDSMLVALSRWNGEKNVINFVAKPVLDVEKIHYKVTFDLPSNQKFYYEQPFEKEVEFVAEVTGDVPRGIYSNDYCVVGWQTQKLEPGESPNTDLNIIHDYDLRLFDETLKPGENVLYPVLMPAEYCSWEVNVPNEWAFAGQYADYLRVMVNSVAGADINFKESRYVYLPSGDVGLDTSVVHTFGSSKQMLLNTAYAQEWFLSYNAKDGFEAPDSLLMTYQASSEKPIWLKNGDIVYTDNLAGKMPLLSGEFKMVDTTALAFVDTLVETTGSTVRVKVSTTKFAAGRDAELLITFMDNLGNLIDTTRKLVHETPYVLDTTYFVQPGSYVVLGLMSDALDSTASFAAISNVAADIPVAKDVWQMVSLNPVDMSAVGKDDDQIFYRWDDEAEVGEFWHYLRFLPGDDVERAGGYWYSSLEGRPLKFSDSYKDSVYDIEWNLVNGYSGWNMVGNPHNWNVKVPDDLEIVMWDPETGDYAPNRGYLKPFEAAWVRVEKKMSVSLDGKPFFADDSVVSIKKRALAKAKNAENWTIRAILADNRGKMDSWNILGMGEAQEGYEPPSGMGDIVSFAVKDGKKYLAKSVKAAPASSTDSSDLVWDVVLSASSDRKGKLYFEGLEGIEAYGYHLYVTVDGKTSELASGDTLQVGLKAAGSTATVRVSKEKLYFRTAVEGLRMVQAGNRLNVGFTATENLDGARMVVDILNMEGKVASSYMGRSVAGNNQIALNSPKKGLYMLRVRVASQQVSGKILVK